jgi:hypothetical protein
MSVEKVRFIQVFLFSIAILALSRWGSTILVHKKQNDLAQRLGVDKDDYADTSPFPANYFSKALQPDVTTIKEAHEIVREYELVLHCRRDSEVYYYYSKHDDTALRIQIIYDQGKYVKILEEDDDSNLLQTQECVPGLLSENLQ